MDLLQLQTGLLCTGRALILVPWALARLAEETCLKALLLSQPECYLGIAEPLPLSSQVASVTSLQFEARNDLLHPYTYYFLSWAKIDLSVSFLFPCCLTDWQEEMDSAFLLEIRGLVAECLSAWAVYLCVHASSDDNTNSNKHAFLSPLPCNIFNIFKSIPSRKPGRSGTVEMRLVKVKILSSISLFLTNFFDHQKVVKQHVRLPSKAGWLYWVAKIASQWVEKQAKMEESPIRKIPSLNEPANLPPFLQGSISEP